MSIVSLQEIVAKVERLPQLPQVALRVSRMLDDPDINASQLADVIKLDAAFTSQVLRLCNSAAYGFSRRISTVKEAVAILGFKVLRSMVYTIIAKIALDRPVPGYSLAEGDLWYNSLTCAVYAKHIAQKERYPDPELAYTGGLLRDIGKLVLGEYVGGNYQVIEQTALSERIDFIHAEEQVLGMNHCMVGTRIAEKWNMPPLLNLVIKHHHRPVRPPTHTLPQDFKLLAIVHLADVFTRMIGRGNGNDSMMYSLDTEAMQKAGINVNAAYIERMLSELVDLNPVIRSLADSFRQESV